MRIFLLARFPFRLGDRNRYAANEMVIVDLYSQRDAAAARLREIDSAGKLNWLRERGELIEIPMSAPFPTAYRFRSNEGIETGFVIRDGKMIFMGDHTTIGAVQIGR